MRSSSHLQRVVDFNPRIDPAERPMKSEHLSSSQIKHIRHETPVRAKPLSSQYFAESAIVFRQVPYRFTCRGQDGVAVGLLKAEEDVHHFELPLNYEGGVGEEVVSRVG